MIENNYAVAQIVGGKMDVKCDNGMFGDPLPGTAKACFCDDVGLLTEAKIMSPGPAFGRRFRREPMPLAAIMACSFAKSA